MGIWNSTEVKASKKVIKELEKLTKEKARITHMKGYTIFETSPMGEMIFDEVVAVAKKFPRETIKAIYSIKYDDWCMEVKKIKHKNGKCKLVKKEFVEGAVWQVNDEGILWTYLLNDEDETLPF